MLSKVCCIGAGYVGGSTLSVIAKMCPEVQVTVVDNSEQQIKAWNSESLPIYEPGLDEIVKERRGKNLFFSTDVEKAINEAEIIFISVNTPTKTCGLGRGRASDLTNLEAAVRKIAQCSRGPKVVVEKSTVPVRAAQTIAKILRFESSERSSEANGSGDNRLHDYVVLSNPEFLAEGSAVKDLMHPDRVLIGGNLDLPEARMAVEWLKWIYLHWIPADRILVTSTWSSELSKLVANAFLAQRISSINAISSICERTGADIREVSKAVGMDHRIGPHFLNSSLGFGGSCFRKDILNLIYMSETLNLPEVANYWFSVLQMNDHQTLRFVNNIISKSSNTLRGKRIAIFGFTFKENTRDTRDTPAIVVCNQLLQENATLAIYDPQAYAEQIKTDLLMQNSPETIKNHVQICSDPMEAVHNAHIIVLCTEWSCFKTLDYQKIYHSMIKPPMIFDGRLILDHKTLTRIGFVVEAIGIDSNLFA